MPTQYDLICLDLFEGVRLALGAMGTPFLRQVASLLAPEGLLTVNLLATARTPDHLRRLARLFTIDQVFTLYGNRVIHCRQLGVATQAALTEEPIPTTAASTATDGGTGWQGGASHIASHSGACARSDLTAEIRSTK